MTARMIDIKLPSTRLFVLRVPRGKAQHFEDALRKRYPTGKVHRIPFADLRTQVRDLLDDPSAEVRNLTASDPIEFDGIDGIEVDEAP
jgi:hypothetical protein